MQSNAASPLPLPPHICGATGVRRHPHLDVCAVHGRSKDGGTGGGQPGQLQSPVSRRHRQSSNGDGAGGGTGQAAQQGAGCGGAGAAGQQEGQEGGGAGTHLGSLNVPHRRMPAFGAQQLLDRVASAPQGPRHAAAPAASSARGTCGGPLATLQVAACSRAELLMLLQDHAIQTGISPRIPQPRVSPARPVAASASAARPPCWRRRPA